MKLVFSLALALATVVGTSSVATADPFTTLPVAVGSGSTVNGATVGGSNDASGFGISISALGATANIGPGALTGTSDASVTIVDSLGNGTASITSTNLLLDDIGGTLIIPAIGANIATSLVGVGIDISIPTITLTPTGSNFTGTFVIDSSTPGSLTLSSGVLTAIGVALGNSVNAVVDLSVDPITVDFADLANSVLLGTANASLAGVDTTSPGSEITLDWAGAESTFTVDLGGFPLTFNLALTGAGLSIGDTFVIPEPTSGLVLASLAVGVGASVRRRRK